MMQCKQLSAK